MIGRVWGGGGRGGRNHEHEGTDCSVRRLFPLRTLHSTDHDSCPFMFFSIISWTHRAKPTAMFKTHQSLCRILSALSSNAAGSSSQYPFSFGADTAAFLATKRVEAQRFTSSTRVDLGGCFHGPERNQICIEEVFHSNALWHPGRFISWPLLP